MCDIESYIERRPRLLHLYAVVNNSVDPNAWKFATFLTMFDLGTTAASSYFAYNNEDWPPFGLQLFAIVLMIVKIPFIAFYWGYAEKKKEQLRAELNKHDGDQDGFLSREEAAQLQFPQGTFAMEFSSRLKRFNIDNLLWYATRPRIFFFRCLEFICSYSMFLASLMLFNPGDVVNAVVFVQGVISVIGLTLVLNDAFSEHGKKFHAVNRPIRLFCNCVFFFVLLASMAVLFSGYAVTAELYRRQFNVTFFDPGGNNTVAQQNQLGIAAGAIVTAIEFVLIGLYFSGYGVFRKCGLLKVRVVHVGDDDPIKLLREGLRESQRKESAPGAIPLEEQERNQLAKM